MIYSDVFGLTLPNNKIIADAYAESGDYLVYLPDFFQSDALQLKVADVLIPVDAAKQSSFSKYTGLLAAMPNFVMWMSRHKFQPTNKLCMDFLQAVRREQYGKPKIGMVGFCWGGRFALRAAMQSSMIEIEGKKVPLVDAVVALHPSNVVLPDDVENPVVPVSIGWGQEDTNTKIEMKGKVEQVHKANAQAGKTLPEIEHIVYKPGRHGFAVRGNPDDPAERKCLEDSEKQALNWMGKWLLS